MRARQIVTTIDTHTCGEPTRIITAGIPPVPGKSMLEKQTYVQQHFDHLRLALLREPRGHRDMFAALLTPPVSELATFGVIFMDNGGYLSGCGHGTIGIGTALVEAGIVPAQEPVTRFSLDTLAGPVHLTLSVKDGRVVQTTFENVPAFLMARDVALKVEKIGTVIVDIAFGGNVFAIQKGDVVALIAFCPDGAGSLRQGLRMPHGPRLGAAGVLRHGMVPGSAGGPDRPGLVAGDRRVV